MCQVFNMGCRMEIYTDQEFAENVVLLAKSFNIDAQIIGRVEESVGKELVIKTPDGELKF